MKRILALSLLLFISSPADALFGGAMKALKMGKQAVDATREFSEPEEIEIGQGVAANLLGAAPLVADENLQKYVNRIGRWVALQSERPGLPWRFGVIDSPDVNAFAAPGGTILITLGLYDRLRDESELAGVLGHEISHVVQKHQIKAIKTAAGRELLTSLGGEVIDRKGGQYSGVAKKLVGVGTEIFIRGLDKRDEYQADRLGMVLAARAGYNPYGLVGVLQTLDAVSPNDGGMALMFKTHPTAQSRIEELSKQIDLQFDSYAESAQTPERIYRGQ